MTTPLQLSSDGLQTQTQQEVFDELGQKLVSVFGNSLNTTLQSVNGQYMWITSELRAVDQQVLLDVYRSFDPNSATGVSLDQRAALTGSIRKGAANSTVDGLIEFGGAGTVNNGDLIRNDDQNTLWEAINGPYTDTGGPYPEYVAATFQAVDTGPKLADAGTNWSVVTVSANFDGFANPVEDATLGRDQETDPEFRARRLIELHSPGLGPLSTINAIVSKVDTDNGRVDTVRTYHNPNINPVCPMGIPFKAFNVICETTPNPPGAGLQQDIFDAILTSMGGGGEAYGTSYTGTAVDVEGQTHPIAFDIVTLVDLYLQITISTADSTGGDGPVIPEDQTQMAEIIRDACVTAATNSFTVIGRDAKEIDYIGTIQNLILSGQLSGIDIIQVDLSDVSKTGPFTPDFLPITIREKIDLDSGEIRVIIDGNVVIA